MTSPRFRTAFYRLLPSWLSSGDGERVAYSLTILLDAFAQRAFDSLCARLPSRASADAVPWLGQDRLLVQGFNETDADFRARLISYTTKHQTRGNAYSLLEQIQEYCVHTDGTYSIVRVVDSHGNWYTRDASGNETSSIAQLDWDWDGADPDEKWSRFWVIIYSDTGPWSQVADLDAAMLTWGVSGMGANITPTQAADLRRIIRNWQPDGTKCEWILISFDPDILDPGDAALPAGTWGRWGVDTAGDYEPGDRDLANVCFLEGVNGRARE